MKMRYFLFVILSYFFSLHASEDAFHAVSSLCFHLEEMKGETETIIFAEEDIASLWEAAFSDSLFYDQVNEAYRSYYQDPLQPKETEVLLKRIWQDMQADLYEGRRKQRGVSYPNFEDNPYLSTEMKSEMRPYLLPLSHPLIGAVDALFSQSRVTASNGTLEQAGFKWICTTMASFLQVVRHPTIPGYIFKIHIDSDPHTKKKIPPWKWLVYRCEGAEVIRNIIKKKKLKYFLIPDKWLYPLPINPPAQTRERQPVVLMVTDMDVVSFEETTLAWRTVVTKAHLDELYTLLCAGYGSAKLDANVPYTKSGKFAFIDTEYPKRKFNFATIKRFLTDEMGEYWDSLVRSGGHTHQP